MQIIHVSGKLDWEEVEAARAQLSTISGPETNLADRYRPYPYLHGEMGAALVAADLALTRAGASTLGELPQAGLPAILVPYPHAWHYQKVNADYLAKRGAVEVLLDQDLQQRLVPLVRDLMQDHSRREKMHLAMCSLAHPEAAKSIAGMLLNFTSCNDQEGKHI
jgi:UDP-N-acetylglucosamine:LPS N-acetylglucosamine transferase